MTDEVVRVALDLLGGDHAPGVVVDGAIQAADDDPSIVPVLVGPPDVARPRSPSAVRPAASPSCPPTRSSIWTRTRRERYVPNATRPSGSPPGWCARAEPTRWYRPGLPARRWQQRCSRSGGCPASRDHRSQSSSQRPPIPSCSSTPARRSKPVPTCSRSSPSRVRRTRGCGSASSDPGSGCSRSVRRTARVSLVRRDAYDALDGCARRAAGGVRRKRRGFRRSARRCRRRRCHRWLHRQRPAQRTRRDAGPRHARPERRGKDDAGARTALIAATAALDPDQVGGGILLGLDGVAVVGHGASSASAIASCVHAAARSVSDGLVPKVAAVLAELVARRRRAQGLSTCWGAALSAAISPEQVFEILQAAVARVMEIDAAAVTRSTSFAADLHADSLALVEVVEIVEEQLRAQPASSSRSTTTTSRTSRPSGRPPTTRWHGCDRSGQTAPVSSSEHPWRMRSGCAWTPGSSSVR